MNDLRSAGISAEGDIREAEFGHISRRILEIADDHDARIIVLGARGRHDVPHLPLGSVSHRLLHGANRPVLIVPRPAAQAAVAGEEPARQAQTARTAETAAAE